MNHDCCQWITDERHWVLTPASSFLHVPEATNTTNTPSDQAKAARGIMPSSLAKLHLQLPLGRLSTETQLRRLGLERVPDCDIHLVMSSGKSLQAPRSLRVPFRLPGCSGLSAPPAALGTRSLAGSPHCMKLGESVVSRPRSYTTVPLLLLIRIGGCVPLP